MADDRPLLTRRQTLAGAALAAAAASTARAQDAATVTATVFERDNDARRGIAGVMVSNGRDVVSTAADGTVRLPLRPGDSLFVIKPHGFMTPVDPATQLPAYAVVHAPDGTPKDLETRFPGLAPTPASPDGGYLFELVRREERTAFEALLFTDPQPETLAEIGYIRDDVVIATAGTTAAFGITHGDVAFDDLSFYPRYNAIIGAIGLPWYNCCGNHDMNLEAPDNALSRDTWKRVFGARHSAFQYGGATFFLLDNVEYLGTDPTKPNGFGAYQGRFGDDQLAFVRNVLANVPADALVVFSHHIPLRTLAGSTPAFANTDTRAFLQAISTHRNTVSFSGHTHTNEHHYFGAEDGYTGGGTHHHHVLAAVSGSWWSGPFDERGIPIALQTDGCPNGFHVLQVDDNRYTTTLVPARDPARGQMRIVLDSQVHRADPEVLKDYHAGALLAGPIAKAAVASTRVVVNVFDGGPRTRVTMTIGAGTGGGAPVEMRRVQRRDPFVDEVYARNAATRKPWVKPELSSHVWQASLPAGLPAGTHRVTVHATDEYGRAHDSMMILEVT